MKIIKKILFIVAMQQEANPLIKKLNLIETNQFDNVLPMRIYSQNDIPEIILVISGLDIINNVDCVGTQAATISTLMAIKTYNPDIIINIGTAGGFKNKGVQLGDVFIAEKVYYHDRRISLPGFDSYGIGGYNCDNFPDITKKLKIKKGIVSTGNSLDLNLQDLEIMKKNKAIIKDMEAAAIVWVSNLYQKPIIVMKAITDYIDYPENDHKDFIQNVSMASHNLTDQCVKLIYLLSNMNSKF